MSLASVATDNSFNASVDGTVFAIAAQPDGKVIIGGTFTVVNGTPRSYLARLNANGSLDTGFAPVNAPAQYVYRVEVAGSEIYVGAGDGIRRYDSNGALEWLYPMQVKTFAVDSQSRVVIGGQFNRVDNQFHRNLARLNANGLLDASFSPEIGCCAGEGVFAISRRGDAMLVGGMFQSVNATNAAAHLALIDATGASEPTFSSSAEAAVLAITTLPDGSFVRVSERTVARHLTSGANDTAFTPFQLSSADDRFFTAVIDADGRIVVGGNVPGLGNVMRLNDDGSIDASFDTETDGAVQAITITADGSVLLGGTFTTVNGSARSGIVKLNDSASSPPAPKLSVAANVGGITLSWSAAAGSFGLESRDVNGATWSAVGATITLTNGANSISLPAAGNGRLYRLRTSN
ncbi:MAG TPA: hypothetical protein VK530_13850 [Candidatus Acidoferrum sp.]|nr:hypothetical protein [Candidatus Acidoferrum sp.]